MAIGIEQFVKNLTDSGVLSAGKLENFIPPRAHPKDAQELAKDLVRSKTLTRYQAQEVYLGRANGLILGSYTILDKIGAGGMGQVFKAQHRRMDRTVAIKMLPAAMTKDGAAVARFEREVKAAAKLDHSNIVTAYDSDEAGGIHFLVMKYVEGSDLAALVKKSGPLSVEKAVDYTLQAAKGLAYAHLHGVIHRDIKPANLLLDREGTVKILDMGLARLEGNPGGSDGTAAELTASGTIMGTVDYMAPEQALNTKHADARSDIYSLGCTLHYLLTGKAPFQGETLMEKLLAHREQDIPDLTAASALPAELQAVFEQLVAKDPADRYASMNEVVQAIEHSRAQLSDPSVARPAATNSSGPASALTFLRDVALRPRKPVGGSGQKTSTVKRVGKSATAHAGSGRPRRTLIAVAAGLLLAALCGFAGWRIWGRAALDHAADALTTEQKPLARSLDALDPAQIPATQRYDWQPKELVAVLGEPRGAHGPGWSSIYSEGHLAISPDGTQLASFSRALEGVRLWDAKTLLPIAAFGSPVAHPRHSTFSPDGKSLAVVSDTTTIWKLSDSKPAPSRTLPPGIVAFAPAGKTLALGFDAAVEIWHLARSNSVSQHTLTLPSAGLLSMSYCQDGKLLATGTSKDFVFLWDMTADPPKVVLEMQLTSECHARTMARSADDSMLAVGGPNGKILIWEVKDKCLIERHVLDAGGEVYSLAFSPDGHSLVAGYRDGTARLWNLAAPESELVKWRCDVEGGISVAFSPDGKTLASFGGENIVRLWDLTAEDPTELLTPATGHRGGVFCVEFSPDGKWLASGGIDQTVRLWDLSGAVPKEMRVLQGHTERVNVVRFSPDGNSLVSGAYNGESILWDLTSGESEHELVLRSQEPHDFHFDAQSRLSLAANGFTNGGAELWDFTGEKPGGRPLPFGGFGVLSAAFSPDGTLVAYTNDKLQVLDISQPVAVERGRVDNSGTFVCFSPDGHLVANVGPNGLSIHDATQSPIQAVTTLKGPAWPWTAAVFSADSQKLIAGDGLGRVLAWDIASGQKIATPSKPRAADPVLWRLPGMVRNLAVSPDGRHLASANSDGSVYILRLDERLAASPPGKD